MSEDREVQAPPVKPKVVIPSEKVLDTPPSTVAEVKKRKRQPKPPVPLEVQAAAKIHAMVEKYFRDRQQRGQPVLNVQEDDVWLKGNAVINAINDLHVMTLRPPRLPVKQWQKSEKKA